MDVIKNNNLKCVKITNKDSLPLQSHWGTMFMIKSNSVIEFYSYYTNEDLDLSRSRPYVEPHYKCSVNVRKLDPNDVKDIYDVFTDTEMESRSLDKTLNFIMALVKSGFECYV
jgi:hypothetical protein